MKTQACPILNISKTYLVLHLMLSVNETSAPYNEHCLKTPDNRQVSICTYFKPKLVPQSGIQLFAGDNSLPGFLRSLRHALESKPDIIHAHAPHFGVLLLLARLLGSALPTTVFTVHNSYPNFKLTNRLLLIPVFAFAQKIICCSRASFDSFPRLYRALAGERLYAVQNGVDLDRVDQLVGGRTQCDRFTVITVGRLINIKNPLTVLQAFAFSADTSQLIFVGDGELRDVLITETHELELSDHVQLTGLIAREQVYQQLSQADLFVSASWGEGLPVATLEAMACGCPVVLSDIPPHREIAAGRDFIPLIHPSDVAGFAQAIQQFREKSVAERAEIGRRCRQLVEERFSLTAMHQAYGDLYTETLVYDY